MTVRAKMVCTLVDAPNGRVILNGVTSGSPENDSFFKWTPAASVDMSTINPSALAQFVQGKQYFVDFTVAD